MFLSTLKKIRCPKKNANETLCGGELSCSERSDGPAASDILNGTLQCKQCEARFPIMAGIAVIVDDVESYLYHHIKGILKVVPEEDYPEEYRALITSAEEELEEMYIQDEIHIEEDLESDRVTALYVMTHYLHATGAAQEKMGEWWKPVHGDSSPLIDQLVREHWDQGPFEKISKWVKGDVVELGCGVGGLYAKVVSSAVATPRVSSYLGVDNSFASIALARHLNLGAPYREPEIKIPEDLLSGPLTRVLNLNLPQTKNGSVDYIVGELDQLPLADEQWDTSVILNAVDMVDEPQAIPQFQYAQLKPGGVAIQSCPYIWHEKVARKLRASRAYSKETNSSKMVESLYEAAGFKISEKIDHVPWLFFKHVRQLEIYSVHMFKGEK